MVDMVKGIKREVVFYPIGQKRPKKGQQVLLLIKSPNFESYWEITRWDLSEKYFTTKRKYGRVSYYYKSWAAWRLVEGWMPMGYFSNLPYLYTDDALYEYGNKSDSYDL